MEGLQNYVVEASVAQLVFRNKSFANIYMNIKPKRG